MQPVDQLFEVLESLHRRHALAMASNRSRTAQGTATRFGLDRYLRLVVGTHDVARPKPAPDMLELCMQRIGSTPETTVFVGDAITDLEAARACGVGFIGIGDHSGATDTISALRDLPEKLESIGAGDGGYS